MEREKGKKQPNKQKDSKSADYVYHTGFLTIHNVYLKNFLSPGHSMKPEEDIVQYVA